MLDPSTVEAIADEIIEAERSRSIIARPAARHEGLTLEDAYSIQRAWFARRAAAGAHKVGHKIGLTSKVMQGLVGTAEPIYGVICDDMVYDSGAVIPHRQFPNARIEVELAFVLREELRGPNLSYFDVLRATDYVVPALEIVNTIFDLDGQTVPDIVADDAAMGGIVLGSRPIRIDDVDPSWIAAMLYRNEGAEDSGVSGTVMGNPALSVAWLANKLAENGEYLAAGEIILSGSFTRPLSVQQGDTVFADYGEFGVVSCRFE